MNKDVIIHPTLVKFDNKKYCCHELIIFEETKNNYDFDPLKDFAKNNNLLSVNLFGKTYINIKKYIKKNFRIHMEGEPYERQVPLIGLMSYGSRYYDYYTVCDEISNH